MCERERETSVCSVHPIGRVIRDFPSCRPCVDIPRKYTRGPPNLLFERLYMFLRVLGPGVIRQRFRAMSFAASKPVAGSGSGLRPEDIQRHSVDGDQFLGILQSAQRPAQRPARNIL